MALALLVPLARAGAETVPSLRADELLRGRFVQERILVGFDAPLRSEGSFVLAPGVGLIWRAEKPFAVTTLMTADGLAQQSDGATTLNLPTSRAPFMSSLYDMLSGAFAGDWRGLERDFSVARSEASGKWTLQLIPRNGASSNALPIVQINIAGGDFVDRVEIVKPGGDRDTLTFLDQQRVSGPLSADEQKLLQEAGQP
ncbi:MAG: outer membrane lipoprotein carrier protein LolA [Rhodospirillaceae bacterium]|nr:outer membrane lipoprotein carrier protein LolA [Rhodospirillaceae bacterium]